MKKIFLLTILIFLFVPCFAFATTDIADCDYTILGAYDSFIDSDGNTVYYIHHRDNAYAYNTVDITGLFPYDDYELGGYSSKFSNCSLHYIDVYGVGEYSGQFTFGIVMISDLTQIDGFDISFNYDEFSHYNGLPCFTYYGDGRSVNLFDRVDVDTDFEFGLINDDCWYYEGDTFVSAANYGKNRKVYMEVYVDNGETGYYYDFYWCVIDRPDVPDYGAGSLTPDGRPFSISGLYGEDNENITLYFNSYADCVDSFSNWSGSSITIKLERDYDFTGYSIEIPTDYIVVFDTNYKTLTTDYIAFKNYSTLNIYGGGTIICTGSNPVFFNQGSLIQLNDITVDAESVIFYNNTDGHFVINGGDYTTSAVSCFGYGADSYLNPFQIYGGTFNPPVTPDEPDEPYDPDVPDLDTDIQEDGIDFLARIADLLLEPPFVYVLGFGLLIFICLVLKRFW